MRKPDKGLTPMEQEVMKVLWESQHELTNSEIAEYMKDQKVSVASVAQTMKRLLEKGAVCVGDHVLVSNVYARTFRPCMSRREFVLEELIRLRDSAYRDQATGTQEILDILVKESKA
nr:BlaI/MecI/CopY family transcriptional regulator [uncultured Blautia sp.]